MSPDDVIREVSPLLGSRWGYQDDYAAFVGPPCPICSHRGCRSPRCLAAVREGVGKTMTVAEVAAVLGVATHTERSGHDTD